MSCFLFQIAIENTVLDLVFIDAGPAGGRFGELGTEGERGGVFSFCSIFCGPRSKNTFSAVARLIPFNYVAFSGNQLTTRRLFIVHEMSALIDSALEVVGIKSSGAKTAAKSIGAVLLVLSILRRVVRSSPFIQDKIIRFMVRTQFRLNYRHALRWFALKDGTDVERDVEARKKQFAVVLVGTNSPLFHSSRAKICTAVVGW